MEKTKINSVYETKDYSCFKRLIGNREIEEARKRKVRNSIEKIGFIPVPIVVNEKMEIEDGQARFDVCKELGIPVPFIVIPGIGMNECIQMNSTLTNWRGADYLHSFAEQGNASYVYLEILLKKYGDSIKDFNTIANATCTNISNNSAMRQVTSGNYECSAKDYERACAFLDYLENFSNIQKQAGGRRQPFYSGVKFFYYHPTINNKTLLTQCKKNLYLLRAPINVEDCIEILEEVYNYGLRSNKKVYVLSDYKTARGGKNA